MTDKELRRLNRKELLELLMDQEKEIVRLREVNEELQKKLDDRTIVLSESGSMAEAALRLNGVFEAADAAVQQLLESIRKNNGIAEPEAEEAEAEEAKADEPGAEEPQAEEAKADETEAEEPQAEEAKAEEQEAEEPQAEEPEEIKPEEPKEIEPEETESSDAQVSAAEEGLENWFLNDPEVSSEEKSEG